jgi:hypothetical protein
VNLEKAFCGFKHVVDLPGAPKRRPESAGAWWVIERARPRYSLEKGWSIRARESWVWCARASAETLGWVGILDVIAENLASSDGVHGVDLVPLD